MRAGKEEMAAAGDPLSGACNGIGKRGLFWAEATDSQCLRAARGPVQGLSANSWLAFRAKNR